MFKPAPRHEPRVLEQLVYGGDPMLTNTSMLVCAARNGDRTAWSQLFEHFEPVVRGIARSFRLQPADVDDVVQGTWIELLDHIDAIRRPEALPGWLATVTRRRALRTLQVGARECLTDDLRTLMGSDDDGDPQAQVIAAERQAALADAVAELPDRPRRVMTMLLCDPAIEYHEISTLLSVPIGSIGPTRARSLSRLSRNGRLCALHRAGLAA
jgi:RNA polymerase sigma factor (sigma-70 family)